MRVLELYSGIGGMHYAFKESEVQGEIVAAVEINTVANEVYKHNFPNAKLLNRNIESLTADFVNKLEVDTLLMSPPCQPFTRNGLQKGSADARTCSFSHILNILPQLNINYMLIENVKGFETSDMRDILTSTLESCNFSYKEYILSPAQFGLCNQRYRYYCLARKSKSNFSECNVYNSSNLTISNFLDDIVKGDEFIIPENVLKKHVNVLDICYKDNTSSCCFTKAYVHYAEGTGSVFCPLTKLEADLIFSKAKQLDSNSNEYLDTIKGLKLRYFSPSEVARLMCFPIDVGFSFPCNITNKQRYRLLGNSINVKLVSGLIKVLAE